MMSCKVACFGIETGSQRVLDANHKGTTVEQNTRRIRISARARLRHRRLPGGGARRRDAARPPARRCAGWRRCGPILDSCNLAIGIPYPGSPLLDAPGGVGIEILDYNYDNQWIVGF